MWILETGSCPVSLLLAPYSSFCSLQPCIWALVSPLLRLLIACWTKSTLLKVACNVLHDFIFACLSKPPPQLPLLARIDLHRSLKALPTFTCSLSFTNVFPSDSYTSNHILVSASWRTQTNILITKWGFPFHLHNCPGPSSFSDLFGLFYLPSL